MTEPDVLRIILSLIFVIALILGGSWLARRAGWVRTGQVSGMKVLGVQSLGARAYIAMVQVEDTRLVVGVTQNSITLLHTLQGSANLTEQVQASASNENPPAHNGSANYREGFSQMLGTLLKKR